MRVELTVLGSGTSLGVPTIGCHCAVCLSSDPRDKRTRPSILLRYNNRAVVIDTGPDFRFQAMRAGMDRLDAVLFTHSHADHVLGMDDIRPFNLPDNKVIPIYGNRPAIEGVRRIFQYVFDGNYPWGGVPLVEAHVINGPLELFGLEFVPIRVRHGYLEVFGFRFGSVAYLTDYNEIPEPSLKLLRGVEIIFLDALRHAPHPAHMTVAEALQEVERIGPKMAYFTHIAHDLGHEETNRSLPAHAQLCYDGMQFEFEAGSPTTLAEERLRGRMQVFRSLEEIAGQSGRSVATVGSFDGIHLAHQELLRRVREIAEKERAASVAITFDPHPVSVLAPEKAPRLLTPTPVKLELIERSGVDRLLILPFTQELSRWPPEKFVEEVLVKALRVASVVVGENFRFGHKQAGTPQVLAELGRRWNFHTDILPRIQFRKMNVSSSQVRCLLEAGKVSFAGRLLGRPFSIRGPIEPGLGIGRSQTVPTLNLAPYPGLIPERGVYVTWARMASEGEGLSGPLRSVTNVGYRPTFGERELGVETHLLDPWEGPPPSLLEVSFLHRLRDERKFDSAEQLKSQILRDIRRAETYFRRLNRCRISFAASL